MVRVSATAADGCSKKLTPEGCDAKGCDAKNVDLDGHAGLLLCPADARWMYVLAHGAGAGMRHSFMVSLAERLASYRVATLRWQFPYMTEGKRRPDRAEVCEAVVRQIWGAAAARWPQLPRFAGGKSMGGRMTSRAHAATALPGLRGLVFVGFPLHPAGEPSSERAEHLARADGPLLFLQGTRDDLADRRRIRRVVAKLGRRATLHLIEGADHGFEVLKRSGRDDADVMTELASTIAAWFEHVAPCE